MYHLSSRSGVLLKEVVVIFLREQNWGLVTADKLSYISDLYRLLQGSRDDYTKETNSPMSISDGGNFLTWFSNED